MKSAAGVDYDRLATATYTLPTGVTQATVYDKYGHASLLRVGQRMPINTLNWDGTPLKGLPTTAIQLTHGAYRVQLRGGTTFTNPADPRIPTVGGDPVIIVESTTH